MTRRILSEKTLQFVVPGRVLRKGATPSRFRRGKDTEFTREASITADGYKSLIRAYAKTAAVQQGWEVKPEDAVYIVVSVNILPVKLIHPSRKGGRKTVPDPDAIKTQMAGSKEPTIQRISILVLQSLLGLAYLDRRQVVGFMVVKRFYKVDALEVLVGTANSWGVLNHDLRNA